MKDKNSGHTPINKTATSLEEAPPKALLFKVGRSSERKNSERLAEKDHYSLLLLHVNFGNSFNKRSYIVAVTNNDAKTLLKKEMLTVIDFKESDIIDMFNHPHEVNEKAIENAKKQFFSHFLTNKKMATNKYQK